MEIIIKNWEIFELTNIPDDEIELVVNNNEKVITEFILSDEEKRKIYDWCILNPDFSITETEQYKQKYKQTLENEKTEIEKELVEVNWLIEWAKKLQAMQIFDADDEIELTWYETKAQELIIKRSEIKAKLKELL